VAPVLGTSLAPAVPSAEEWDGVNPAGEDSNIGSPLLLSVTTLMMVVGARDL